MHSAIMRTHADVIKAAGPQVVHDALGFEGKLFTVKSWAQRDSIPGEYWAVLDKAGIASLQELAMAATAKRVGKPEGQAA